MHGWLDNAASFSLLGPSLARAGWCVWAVDLPGHGQSDWLPAGAGYALADYIPSLLEGVTHQSGASWYYLGHSLGAVIGMLALVAAPGTFVRAVWIDALGPMTTPPGQTADQFRKAIHHRLQPVPETLREYASPEEAARHRASRFSPSDMSAARIIMARSLVRKGNVWQLRADPRVSWPSTFRLCEAQIQEMLEAIACPVTVIGARQGLVKKPGPRMGWLSQGNFVSLSGGHHLHMENTALEAVTNEVVKAFA